MRQWESRQDSSTNRTPTACLAASRDRCGRYKTLSLLSCQWLQALAKPKGVAPATPTPFSTSYTRCWQHLETGLKIDSIMSQC